MSTLATLITQLKTRRDAIIAELSALDATKAGGLPNSGGIGVTVDHVGYKDGLYRELQAINKQIANFDVGVIESEGY